MEEQLNEKKTNLEITSESEEEKSSKKNIIIIFSIGLIILIIIIIILFFLRNRITILSDGYKKTICR